MNVKLLRKVKKHILEEPRRFAMGVWVNKTVPGARVNIYFPECSGFNEYEADQIAPKCGTIACIGGWIELLSPDSDGMGIYSRQRLFTVEGWPDDFAKRYIRAKTPKTRAKIAAERIEHFIATKGAE